MTEHVHHRGLQHDLGLVIRGGGSCFNNFFWNFLLAFVARIFYFIVFFYLPSSAGISISQMDWWWEAWHFRLSHSRARWPLCKQMKQRLFLLRISFRWPMFFTFWQDDEKWNSLQYTHCILPCVSSCLAKNEAVVDWNFDRLLRSPLLWISLS